MIDREETLVVEALFELTISSGVGLLLARQAFYSIMSSCFARKQAKSHKGRIWCRLRRNMRCNQPLELD